MGDDAAVLAAAAGEQVWTVDTLVEEVDFRRRWAAPADVGHKAAAVNLSDLAAMGARPRGLLLAVTAVSLYLLAPALIGVFGAFDELDEINPLWFVAMVALQVGSFGCMWGILRLAVRSQRTTSRRSP